MSFRPVEVSKEGLLIPDVSRGLVLLSMTAIFKIQNIVPRSFIPLRKDPLLVRVIRKFARRLDC